MRLKKQPAQEKKAPMFAATYNTDRSYQIILDGLKRLMEEDTQGFVIFSDPVSEHFVQFLKVDNDTLMFDMPMVGLSKQAYGVALDFFDRYALVSLSKMKRKGYFQMNFSSTTLEDAAGLAVAVLQEVFGLEGNIRLKVEFGE